ncbi:TIGR01458 family HAD-type hydrolase [Methyloradius palustris]|uniref:Haloacid dehalogenase-like hydrolase domain-containing protein 2 n=1 Tax=Methyloradius palustris TaxID=2778876 RepID=A0A8D5JYK1_9PROT|nr:TIGR01458 family HAD-type hydrolase [Methyloradius palustris]BCM24777.1 haloacid dehalogenase [Methyloradius palustris]
MNHSPTAQISSIKGILFDLDGVLYVGKSQIDGAMDAVASIRAKGIACRFVTNTSTLSLDSLQKKISAFGLDVEREEIISAPQAALLYLRKQSKPICRFLLADDVKKDFAEFRQSNTEAEFIVVGDIGDAWSYKLLNELFNCLMDDAKLIAIHKNKFWETEYGLQMDIGSFIAGLEYASGSTSMIIGKPSADFFQIALDDMGLKPSEVIMVGDDIDSDIGGAQAAGIKGVLVRTGKFRQGYFEASTIKPDWVIDSVRDLPALLGL